MAMKASNRFGVRYVGIQCGDVYGEFLEGANVTYNHGGSLVTSIGNSGTVSDTAQGESSPTLEISGNRISPVLCATLMGGVITAEAAASAMEARVSGTAPSGDDQTLKGLIDRQAASRSGLFLVTATSAGLTWGEIGANGSVINASVASPLTTAVASSAVSGFTGASRLIVRTAIFGEGISVTYPANAPTGTASITVVEGDGSGHAAGFTSHTYPNCRFSPSGSESASPSAMNQTSLSFQVLPDAHDNIRYSHIVDKG